MRARREIIARRNKLYLKHFTILANRLQQSGATMQQGHDILRNWDVLKALFAQINNSYFDSTEIGIVQDILEDIVSVDATGQVFRYPEGNRGEQHLEDIAIINVEILEAGMRIVFELFEKWDSGLIGLLEDRQLSTSSI